MMKNAILNKIVLAIVQKNGFIPNVHVVYEVLKKCTPLEREFYCKELKENNK